MAEPGGFTGRRGLRVFTFRASQTRRQRRQASDEDIYAMSMPAIFFVSDRSTAEQMELNHSLPAEDVSEWQSLDTLALSTLWNILSGGSSDPVSLMKEFSEVRFLEEEWTHQIPEQFVSLLASATQSQITSAASAWVQTEEMSEWDGSDAADLLTDVQRLARRAQQLNRPLFSYLSL